MNNYHGWGRYPQVSANSYNPHSYAKLAQYLAQQNSNPHIARGMGRSYGDSSLAHNIINSLPLDNFINFDSKNGILTAQAGVTIDEVLQLYVPQGWFLPATPGTKFISLAGAVASDVHGKNHHVAGSFCNYVQHIKLMLANGEIISCSPQDKLELFQATCGGMGLTGVILEISITLQSIKSSYIEQTTIKTKNLVDTFNQFKKHKHATYSVAWIDCLATGNNIGRCVLNLGEHIEQGELSTHTSKAKINIPCNAPSWLMSNFSISMFNKVHYTLSAKYSTNVVHYDAFFYPLDKINAWNRLYGKQGFIQYQCVIPENESAEAIHELLKQITLSKKGSFLAVLKYLGDGNNNYLSFPKRGYTLALDFKFTHGLLELLETLDEIVASYGGRIYLAKDACVSEQNFKNSYPNWSKFYEIRKSYGATKLFHSLQSQRLDI